MRLAVAVREHQSSDQWWSIGTLQTLLCSTTATHQSITCHSYISILLLPATAQHTTQRQKTIKKKFVKASYFNMDCNGIISYTSFNCNFGKFDDICGACEVACTTTRKTAGRCTRNSQFISGLNFCQRGFCIRNPEMRIPPPGVGTQHNRQEVWGFSLI